MAHRVAIVHPDAESLAHAAAARIITALIDLQSSQRPVHLVLTGGTVGIATLAALAESPARRSVDWSGIHLWWGDERYLPAGDPDRNEVQAHRVLLDSLQASGELPRANVHTMPAATDGVSVHDAAAQYAAQLAEFGGGAAVPPFDIVMLGVGPDAHVASLFPGSPAVSAPGTAVGISDSPKPPPKRVSLTFTAIRSAKQVWLIAAGGEKADAVKQAWLAVPAAVAPAGHATGRDLTLWLLDSAAAAQL